jgi:predicted RNA-binding Zn ribbon-like protein
MLKTGYHEAATRPEGQPIVKQFKLSEGLLCLDFANTWGNHLDPGSDRLGEYPQVLGFARQAGLVDQETAVALREAAHARPEEARRALRFARELRQAIYRILSAKANRRDLPTEDLDQINANVGDALRRRRLELRDGLIRWGWVAMDGADLNAPIWPIIESAVRLFTSEDFERVRECDARDCNWLFLDRSHGRSRRWCSMKSCGNRAKARRHYQRKRNK